MFFSRRGEMETVACLRRKTPRVLQGANLISIVFYMRDRLYTGSHASEDGARQ